MRQRATRPARYNGRMNTHENKNRRDTLLRWAEERLVGVADSPRREARLLLGRAAGIRTTEMLAFPERDVPGEAAARFREWIDRRSRHEPVAHLIGERGFRGLDLVVTSRTLIPRPDTECLVDAALEPFPEQGIRTVDLGTGTGAIALALAQERPHWSVTATERDDGALHVARRNSERLGLPIRFLQGSWFDALPAGERFTLIVSNPPYVASDDPHLDAGDLPWEPHAALVSGPDGLDDIRHLVRHAPHHLEQGGWLMLEHGHDQGETVRSLFAEAGFSDVETRRDLGGRERVTRGRMDS